MVVYISHSRQNAGIANKLFDTLQSRQVKPWLDQRDLDAGADWNEQVASAIRSADAIVFLIGPGGPNDRFQNFEWQQVVDEVAYLDPTKALIPVVIGDAELPGFLSPRKPIPLPPTSMDFKALTDAIVCAVNKPEETVDQEKIELGRQARVQALRKLRDYSRELAEREAKERACKD
jgi:hypothetical protein